MTSYAATTAKHPGSGDSTTNTSATTSWPSAAEIMATPHWFLSLTFSFVIIFINSWIAFSFIHHAVTSEVLKKKRSRRDVNGGLVMILAIATVVAPFIRYFGTLYLLFVGLNPSNKSGCETANDFCVAGYGLAVLPNYSFLWARQRAFYGHPSLGHMFGPCVSVFSNISLALIILTTIALLVLGIYPNEYQPGPGGCFLKGGEEEQEWRTYVYAVVMISCQLVLLGLFLHPIVLHAQRQKGIDDQNSSKNETAEFSTDAISSAGDGVSSKSANDESNVNTIYNSQIGSDSTAGNSPKSTRSLSVSVNHRLQTIARDLEPHRRCSAEPTVGQRKTSLSPPVVRQASRSPSLGFRAAVNVSKFKKRVRRTTMRSRKIHRLIKRVLFLAVISVFSDLFVMVINAFIVPDDIPQDYAFVMYDATILVNVISVVLSFEKWRIMMLSPCPTKKTK